MIDEINRILTLLPHGEQIAPALIKSSLIISPRMTGNSTSARGINARDRPSKLARITTTDSLAASFGKSV